jgi:hypothetical protein
MADANRRAVKRTAHNDAQNATNASWRVVQRTACNDAQIALKNVGHPLGVEVTLSLGLLPLPILSFRSCS